MALPFPRAWAQSAKPCLYFWPKGDGPPDPAVVAEQQAELLSGDVPIEAITEHIKRASATQPVCQRLEQVPGIVPLSASALWLKASGQPYQNGRHLAAALGLVPKHTGTGARFGSGESVNVGIGISGGC